jgi:hypothetical protein
MDLAGAECGKLWSVLWRQGFGLAVIAPVRSRDERP